MNENFTLINAMELSITGILVVVFSLFMLMIMLLVLGKILEVKNSKKTCEPSIDDEESIENQDELSYISGGVLDLHDVDDKTAVLIMAIVAYETKIPLNELVFKSIKEIKEG